MPHRESCSDQDGMLLGPAGLARREDRVAWQLHLAVAVKLLSNPAPVLARVPANLARQRKHVRGPGAHAWLDEWEALTSGPLDSLIALMLDTSAHSIDMRQVGPFIGVLTDAERLEAIARANSSSTDQASAVERIISRRFDPAQIDGSTSSGKSTDTLAALLRLGSTQWGMVTTTQAKVAGVSRYWLDRLIEQEVIHRIRRGVYALPSADHGPLQDLRGAWLVLNTAPNAHGLLVVSGASAASVYGLGEVLPARHNFTSSVRRRTTQYDLRIRHRELDPADVVILDGLPVTSIRRTIADISDHIDVDHLTGIVRNALEQGDVTPDELAAILDLQAQRLGAETGRDLVESLHRRH